MTSIPPPLRKRRLVLRWFLRLLALALFSLLGLVALIYFRQHSMLYHPRSYDASYEQSLPNDGVELQFNTLAGKQTAFYLPHGAGTRLPKHIWVAFCGNGSVALDWVWLLGKDRNPDDAFLLIDYPGYGKSEGYATIGSTRGAADKALDTLAAHLGVTKGEIETHLNVIGHSLGAAAALDFATGHPIQRTILISPFTTLREEAVTVVGGLLSYLLIENYDNRAYLRELSHRSPAPHVTIFHGTNDNVIPMRMGRDLGETFPAIVSFHPVKGADHVSVLGQAEAEILAAMNE